VNYLENTGRDFVICDDKTGAMLDVSQRVDAVAALQYIHEIYGILQKTKSPSVAAFEVYCALQTLCVHFGWSPSEIAILEQYAAATGRANIGGSAPTTG
jgi:hypothetical protein